MEALQASTATRETPVSPPALSEQQKRDFCAELLQRYGLQLNLENELLPELYLSYQAALISETTSRQTSDNLAHMTRMICDMERRISLRPYQVTSRPIQLQDTRQAFWLGFGAVGLPLLLAALVGAVCWIVYQHSLTRQEKNTYLEYLLDHAAMHDLTLDDTTSVKIMRLYPSESLQKARAGRNYVYDPKHECINIPLFYERKD